MYGVGILDFDDNLATIWVVLDNREWTIPSSPVVFGSRGSMVVYQISLSVVVLAGNRSLSAQCTVGLGYRSGLRDSF